jgi:ATP-binding cassette, subfamily B, bacterial
MHPLRRLADHARPYRAKAAAASVFSALNKLFDVLPEVLIGVAVDVVVNRRESFVARLGLEDPLHQLGALIVATILVWVLESTFEYLYGVAWRNLAQDLQHELRVATWRHVQRLDPDTLATARTGRLMAVLNEDIHQVERFFNGGINDLIQVVVGTLMVAGVFFALTPTLAVLALLPVPLIAYGAFWFQRRLAPRYAAARAAASTVSARLNDNLLGMATIQAYTAEEVEAERLAAASDAYRARNAEAIRLSVAITPVIRMGVLAGFTATLGYGGYAALTGALGVGSFSALVYLTQRLLWPLTRLADLTDLYQRSMVSVRRVMDLLDTPITTPPATHVLARPVRGEVVFDRVTAAYGDHVVLDDVSLVVPAGATVALVGPTGSGKTTLLRLLLRFVEPRAGAVLFDGVPIAGLDPTELRQVIGYVAQEPFLTDGTVEDNVAYGREAEPERVRRALVDAEAMAFVDALPDGVHSAVGERGHRLSGGQRQRIAVSRALYREPAVLVLDEATSAVDNETEAAIQRSLRRASQGRTTLVVAHRLSTVRHADTIHVVVDGRIVESGAHEALVARDGAYAALWRLQTGEG